MESLLEATITELLSVDPSSMDDAELHAFVVVQQRFTSQFAVVRGRFLAEWDARGTWALDRSRSAAARLSRETGCSPETARAEIKRARAMRTMPATSAALADGTLSLDRADLLVQARKPETTALFARDETMLIGYSAGLVRFDEFATAVKHWTNIADDEACEQQADRDHETRFFKVQRRRNGMVHIEGLLDAVTGAAFCHEYERIEDELFREDWAEAKERVGDDVCLDKLARRPRHRAHDAVGCMARRSAATPENARQPRPLFTVLVGYETFAGRVCQLADGTALTPGQVAGLLGEADIERIVFAGRSRIIDVGRRTRAFPGALRRAIEVRDRHCTIAGCDVPAARCEVDHITEHSEGGETTQANGRLLCPTHNRQRPGRTSPPIAGP
ncbi:hypothetical protein BH10ACT1_BH10ACT1_02380 [soil metagenome]